MKILYFGTICDISKYEQILKKCKSRPTVATIVFESALLDGFNDCELDITIFSFPMIPTYPNSKILGWGAVREELSCGYNCTWLRTLNIPIVKQMSRKLHGRSVIKKWIKKNEEEDCVILTYSIPPFLASDIVRYCKKNHVNCYAIIPDLLRDMYINTRKDSFKYKIYELYLKKTIKIQGEFDGYVYLTEAMKDVINPCKPYIIMEGVADISDIQPPQLSEKKDVRAIMYAGGIYYKYGVINLIDAFEKAQNNVNGSIELWLFGDGDAVGEIEKRSKKNLFIHFFGRRSREDILIYERKASLLVNVRSTHEDFTAYSFPSKTIEYMLSGTPVLTTELAGIPDDYFEYVFHVKDNSVDVLTKKLEEILVFTDEELLKKGMVAQRYIAENKNGKTQAERIIKFCELVNKKSMLTT